MKNNKNGITLIALVITIIVLLILAGISISLVTGQNGVLTRAEDASNTYSMSSAKEQANMRAAGYVSEYTEKVYVDNDLTVGAMTTGEYVLNQINGKEDGDYRYSVSGSTITVTSKTTGQALASGTIGDDGGIAWSDTVASGGNTNTNTNTNTSTNNNSTSPASSSESYIGYYAYVDGVWGIIYADLLAQTTRSGSWGNSDGAWNIGTASAASAYKSYTVSALPSSGGPSTFGGYTSANSNTGVIELASNSNGLDRFYVIETTNRGSTVIWTTAYGTTAGTNSRWRLPTKQEWSIFGSTFEITSSNYRSTYGLSNYYWSSTEDCSNSSWFADFERCWMNLNDKEDHYSVRLCTTF